MKNTIVITTKGDEKHEIILQDAALVLFENDTENNFSADRSGNIVNRITIEGVVTEETKDATRDVFLWSLDNVKEKIYRTVAITIKQDESTTLREFVLDNAFILDYRETADAKNDTLTYELVISQRQLNISNIKIYTE